MHTGDGGYMDEDGFIYLVDRMKDMIISGGENVYSAEVENVVMGFTGVAMCAVIGTPDPKMGECVTVIIQPKPGADAIELKPLQDYCREHIAGYKLPRRLEVMEALPTVILGFLAGLWLAPFIETFLPGIFLMVVFLILAMRWLR